MSGSTQTRFDMDDRDLQVEGRDRRRKRRARIAVHEAGDGFARIASSAVA